MNRTQEELWISMHMCVCVCMYIMKYSNGEMRENEGEKDEK